MNLNSHIHKKGNFYEIITFIYDSHSCCIVKRVQYSDTSYKGSKNGETTLKIGSLQGYYDVQTLKAEKGNVEIPYEAAVEEGTILLQVTKDDKVIYEEEITSQKEGLLSLKLQNPDHMI